MPGAVPEETFGDYRLTHLLGKGGMASVFRAVRSGPMGFAKVVAIKRLHEALTDNDQVLKSLINESRLGGQLKHPNIVEVYEFNRVGDTYFLSMEFVDGWTLDRVVKLSQELSLPIPDGVVLDILIQVCEGLQYAHNIESLEGEEVRLVHRDLKPANIILGRDGVVKVMDFGIAKAATNLFKTTLADTTKGTPHYMSPEQVAGAPDLGPTSDLFALGSVLFELLTGKVLFTGESLVAVLFAVARAEVDELLAPLDERIDGLSFVLGKCLEKDPDERYQSAEVLIEDLRRLRDESDDDGGIKAYLYALRGRMLEGKPEVEDDEDGPEFATLLVHGNLDDHEDLQDEIAETKKAADKVIGEQGGKIRLGEDVAGLANLDTMAEGGVDDETLAATPSRADMLVAREGRKRKKKRAAEISPAGSTRSDIKPTRVYTPGDTPERKRRRLLAVLAVAILLTVGGTILWIQSPPTPTPVAVVDTTPTPDGLDSLPDLAPPDEPTPKPKTGRKTPRRTPKKASPTPAPTPAPVAVQPTPGPTPVDLPGPTPAPTPEAVASIAGTGVLKARASKPFALVFIDGRDTGEKTPMFGGIKLAAGKHTVELRSPERGEAVKKTIEIKADATFVLDAYDFANKRWMK